MAEGAASDRLEDTMKNSFLRAIKSGSNDAELEESTNSFNLNAQSLIEVFRQGGLRALSSSTLRKLTNWQSEPVNIAVIGRTGVGKSSFINAIRKIDHKSPFFAPVGCSETTKKATPYQHQDHKLLVFWDLPGAGTSSYPRKDYLTNSNVNFKMYDVYIIICSDRFTEDETWLANEIKRIGKLFLFVRTKVDIDIENDVKCYKSDANAAKVVETIRNDCRKNIAKVVPDYKDVYLIASLEIDNKLLDFEKLFLRIYRGLPELKAEALLYSLNIMAPEILEAKVKSLRKRIWGMGVLSAASGAIPIPGIGLVADAALIAGEAKFYRKQLGITKADLEAVADAINIPVNVLAEKYNLKSFALTLTSKGVIGMSALVASELIETAAGLAIPVIGSVVGASVSFVTTVKILRALLDIMATDAKQVLELLTIHTGRSLRVLCMTDTENE